MAMPMVVLGMLLYMDIQNNVIDTLYVYLHPILTLFERFSGH